MSYKPSDESIQTAEVFHKMEVSDLKAKIADLNEKHKLALSLLHDSNSRLNAILGLKDEITGSSPVHMKVKPEGRLGESTAVLVTSDWHLEERVDPRTIDGVNQYDPTIAEKRVKKFFENGLAVIEMCRTSSRIDVLVLAVLGDLIAGYLHEELLESNYLSPSEASLKAYRLLCGGIDFFLKEGKFKRILIPCNFGNHGRTTARPRVSTAAKNSYEWLMYQLVAEKYHNENRVEMHIADGYFNFVEVYDTTLRLHHGDNVKYQGGVGGVEIPLNKAIAQWNKMRKASIDVLGHWHTRRSGRDFVINGSVIGFNPYALSIKASFEPPQQTMFLIHPEYGRTIEAPVFVQ